MMSGTSNGCGENHAIETPLSPAGRFRRRRDFNER
jgi:hypothetical protein